MRSTKIQLPSLHSKGLGGRGRICSRRVSPTTQVMMDKWWQQKSRPWHKQLEPTRSLCFGTLFPTPFLEVEAMDSKTSMFHGPFQTDRRPEAAIDRNLQRVAKRNHSLPLKVQKAT